MIPSRDLRFIESDTSIPKVDDPTDPGPACANCGSKDEVYPSRILLCDCPGCPRCLKTPNTPGCVRAHHMACLRPPLTRQPKGDWICPGCAGASPAWEYGGAVRPAPAPPEQSLTFQPRIDRSDPSNTTYTFEQPNPLPSPPLAEMRGSRTRSNRLSKPPQRLAFATEAPAPSKPTPTTHLILSP